MGGQKSPFPIQHTSLIQQLVATAQAVIPAYTVEQLQEIIKQKLEKLATTNQIQFL